MALALVQDALTTVPAMERHHDLAVQTHVPMRVFLMRCLYRHRSRVSTHHRMRRQSPRYRCHIVQKYLPLRRLLQHRTAARQKMYWLCFAGS